MGALKKDQWVLVVDDDPDVRELLVDDLIDQFDGELRIVQAADGVQASGKLENQSFDCIITDLKMPKRDGDHFIEWVRESQRNKNVPIVVVTGYPEPHLIEKYPNVHFLDKPVDFRVFGETVKTQLKLGRMDQRISADFFNASVDSTRRFFSKVLEAIPVVENPEQKTANDPLDGEILTYFSVQGSYGRCDIAIGYDVELLKLLSPNGESEAKKLAMAATSTVISQMIKTYHQAHRNEKTPQVQGKQLLEASSELYQRLSKSPGLKVPISMYEHRIHLTMITKKTS